MSLYGPTFHVTPADLCIILKCNLYISCIMSCGNKIASSCFICILVIYLLAINYYQRFQRVSSNQSETIRGKLKTRCITE